MSAHFPRTLFLLALLTLALAACSGQSQTAASPTAASPAATEPSPAATTAPAETGEVSFARDVLPILEANCTRCHGSSRQSDGLAMNTYAALLEGSSTGAVVIASDATGSKLVEVISNGRMPKNATPLTAEEIQLISDWINAGALDN